MFDWVADADNEPGIARIQWSLNAPRSDWKARNMLERGKNALCKVDIAERDWVFIDFDRASGFSAMDEYDVAHVLRFLAEFGIPEPLLISSGRGLNALWRAGWSIEVEPDFHALCRGLAHKFNDEYITVDDATSPERGAKIPGTMARKTDDPAAWKPVYILNPDVATPAVPKSAWQQVIDALRADCHAKEFASPSNGFGARVAEGFDIYDFCEAYDIEILAEHGDRFDIACPLKGERHSGSASVTSLFYDGERLAARLVARLVDSFCAALPRSREPAAGSPSGHFPRPTALVDTGDARRRLGSRSPQAPAPRALPTRPAAVSLQRFAASPRSNAADAAALS